MHLHGKQGVFAFKAVQRIAVKKMPQKSPGTKSSQGFGYSINLVIDSALLSADLALDRGLFLRLILAVLHLDGFTLSAFAHLKIPFVFQSLVPIQAWVKILDAQIAEILNFSSKFPFLPNCKWEYANAF